MSELARISDLSQVSVPDSQPVLTIINGEQTQIALDLSQIKDDRLLVEPEASAERDLYFDELGDDMRDIRKRITDLVGEGIIPKDDVLIDRYNSVLDAIFAKEREVGGVVAYVRFVAGDIFYGDDEQRYEPIFFLP